MLGIRCPSCGAPTPLALSDDYARCVHCGVVSALPDAARIHLEDARRLLSSLDVRQRQLSEAERRALGREQTLRGLYVVASALFVLVIVAMLGLFTIALFDETNDVPLGIAAWMLGPGAITVGTFFVISRIYLRRLERARLALEDACAAVPPHRAGEAPSCHVCGAALRGEGVAAFTRCGYCHADNLVAREVLARRTHAEALVLDDFASVVRSRASVAHGGAVRALALLPFVVVGSGMASCCLFIGAYVAAAQVERDVVDPPELVWLENGAGTRCVAEIHRPAGAAPFAQWGLDQERHALPERLEAVDLGALPGGRFPGRSDRPGLEAEPLVVERIYASPWLPGTVFVRARTGTGTSRFDILSGLCRDD